MASSVATPVVVQLSSSIVPAAEGSKKQADDTLVYADNPQLKTRQDRDICLVDVSYTVKDRNNAKKELTILNGVNGTFRAGQVTAILGPSGAGKTTELGLLAGRLTPTAGALSLGKIVTTAAQRASMSSFVQQDDCILPTMTVREAIFFAALLRLPKSMPTAKKHSRADQVIDRLGLRKCADTLVGAPELGIVGISGGERKRTAIGMNIVTNPGVLFLDEPTSGLDSFTAHSVVSYLNQMSADGTTVIMTVHQPSSDVFSLFHDVVLLVSGHTMFHGPQSQVVPYFASIGFPCPKYSNPADYLFMHVVNTTKPAGPAADQSSGEVEPGKSMDLEAVCCGHSSADRVQHLLKSWGSSSLAKSSLLDASALVVGSEAAQQVNHLIGASKENGASTCQKFRALTGRSCNELRRNKMRIKTYVAQTFVFSLMISIIYVPMGNNQASIQDRRGALFFCSMNGMMTGVLSVLTTFAGERAAFIRERSNNLYSTPVYFFAKMVTELPIIILAPFVYMTLVYWIVGLQPTAGKYLVAVMCQCACYSAGASLGILAASSAKRVEVALAIAPAILLPLMFFSGFFINSESVPVYFRWIEYISPIKYAFSALMMNEFDGLELACDSDELQTISQGNSTVTFCPFTQGSQIVDLLNLWEWMSIPAALAALAGEYILCSTLSLIALSVLANRERGT